MLHAHIGELFSGMAIRALPVPPDPRQRADRRRRRAENLRTALQASCAIASMAMRCGWKSPTTAPSTWKNSCSASFNLEKADVYRVEARSTWWLMQVPDLVDRPDLKYRPFLPGLPLPLAKRMICWPPSARVMCCCITSISHSSR